MPDPADDPLGQAVVAVADLYASIAMDEALAADLRAQASAPDRAPLWPAAYDV